MAPVRPNVLSIQDNPPPGGYPKVNTRRGIKPRGPTGSMIWAGMLLSTIYGFYRISQTNEKKRYVRKETRDARLAILPYLMAEQEFLLVLKLKRELDREREIMKDVDGWEVGKNIYSRRWVAPAPGH